MNKTFLIKPGIEFLFGVENRNSELFFNLLFESASFNILE